MLNSPNHPSTAEAEREAPTAQKSRKGLERLRHALRYSLAGLQAGWLQAAFRSESVLAVVMVPAAFWLGKTWVEVGMLAGAVVLVLIVELLNTGIETAIDRIGPEWHLLSKQAKDMGSAAVLLSLLLCGGLWAAALYNRFV
ncbi:diacylglycerol kinase [Xylophilus rhododendri]|uniref:Diacylglycerol kinase n=1 Tax=Xylophilus rhododendri TaxID=2697032 RepID=A0A857J004_9BURK|nr:diacylglycerol kinase [Xylophilus rhododendri]QHI96907.1 diacylglycerol kinase [Xylophilus rhododendri]